MRTPESCVLVDCGGGHEILGQLAKVEVGLGDIDLIFISHSHADHVLGFPFLFRRIVLENRRTVVACSRKVQLDLMQLIGMDLPTHVVTAAQLLTFHDVEEKPHRGKYRFFPVDDHQYGFMLESGGKKIAFTGDVPCTPSTERIIVGCDVLIHDAFCADADRIARHGCHSTMEEAMACARRVGAGKLAVVHSATDLSRFASPAIVVPSEGQSIFL